MALLCSSRRMIARLRAGLAHGPRRSVAHRAAVAQALRNVSYEVLPLKNAEESILAHVPKDVRLTVTTTEAKGLGPTLDLAVRLARRGYNASPHVAARLVRDQVHLSDIVARLDEAGVDGVFVVGGDASEPAGTFPDALTLLQALKSTGHHFRRVGIGGYPEGHGHISSALIDRALEQKAPHATHIITQLCFHPDTTAEWARRVLARGVDLPILVGLPGAVSRQKLVRISATLGLGQSARFLQKQHSMFWRFFLPGGYSPDPLIEQLSNCFGEPDNRTRGFHLFTFNELEQTEAWRRAWLARLA